MTRDHPDEKTRGVESESSAESNSITGSLRADWTESGHPSLTIVELVGVATNCDPDQLPALHEYVDVEALDALVRSPRCDSRSSVSLRLSFVYDGTPVTVEEDGTVTVPLESVSHECE
ncbi:HalOD1 output domain-containing protein [Saliphagus sp. LR7]|uniref:HalOD1 output domain-containing protein n=1 Tax=Saliphagus sp. LR7 TaxID=2282654 RepID=UPI003742D0E5